MLIDLTPEALSKFRAAHERLKLVAGTFSNSASVLAVLNTCDDIERELDDAIKRYSLTVERAARTLCKDRGGDPDALHSVPVAGSVWGDSSDGVYFDDSGSRRRLIKEWRKYAKLASSVLVIAL